ncbi:MAG: DUF2188 domain-containing protein [Actinomycetota bacterium]|nr:DUF2188 domain-containing protein [Actinomycetota bacterium]
MVETKVQVLPDHGDWKITVDGTDRDERFPTQGEAEEAGRRLAKLIKAGFQLHARTGNIREKGSFGNDPDDIAG